MRKVIVALLCIGMMVVFAVPAMAFYWEIDYPSSITVGDDSMVEIYVETDADIDLHVCFKGEFTDPPNYWTDHWTYEVQEVVLSADTTTTNTFTFTIPYDLYVESLAAPEFLAQNYYFYVFSTTPGGPWGTGSDNKGPLYYPAPDGANTTTVTYLAVDKALLLSTAIRMIEDKIIPPPGQPDTWTAGEGLRESLMAKLDNARKMVSRGNFNAAKRMMKAFINELESNNQAAAWDKAGECIALAENIIEWIEVY